MEFQGQEHGAVLEAGKGKRESSGMGGRAEERGDATRTKIHIRVAEESEKKKEWCSEPVKKKKVIIYWFQESDQSVEADLNNNTDIKKLSKDLKDC